MTDTKLHAYLAWTCQYLRSTGGRCSFTDLENTFKDWCSLICDGNSLNIWNTTNVRYSRHHLMRDRFVDERHVNRRGTSQLISDIYTTLGATNGGQGRWKDGNQHHSTGKMLQGTNPHGYKPRRWNNYWKGCNYCKGCNNVHIGLLMCKMNCHMAAWWRW